MTRYDELKEELDRILKHRDEALELLRQVQVDQVNVGNNQSWRWAVSALLKRAGIVAVLCVALFSQACVFSVGIERPEAPQQEQTEQEED